MNLDDNFEQILDNYLNNLLEDEELKEMERRLERERKLNKGLKTKKEQKQGEWEGSSQRLSHEVDKYEYHLLYRKRRRRLLNLVFSSVAFFVLSLAGYLWFFQKATPDRLFTNHFEAYQGALLIEKEDSNQLNKNWESAITLFNAKRFDEAIPLFESILKKPNKQPYLAHFCLSNAYLAQKDPQPERAIQELQQVFITENNYQNQAQWYLVLAHLKMRDLETAKTALTEIAQDEEHYKQQEAQRLLKQM